MRRSGWREWAGLWIASLLLIAGAGVTGVAAQTKDDDSPGKTPWLGVMMQELTDELRESMNVKGDGVLVADVVDGSPAEKAGIRRGDLVTTVNSRAVTDPEDLQRMIRNGRTGQTVSIGLVRDGRTMTVSATLTERAETTAPAPPPMRMRERGDTPEPPRADRDKGDFEFEMPDIGGMMGMGMAGRGRLGVRVEALNPDLGGYFSVPGGKGVLVVEVMKDTPAEKAGLKAGDVITKVGSKSVEDPEDLVRALRDEGKSTTLFIVRKGQSRTLQTELNQPRGAMRMYGNDESAPGAPGDGKRITIRRQMDGPDIQDDGRRIFIRRSLDGPEADNLRRELRDLRRQLDDLKDRVKDLEK